MSNTLTGLGDHAPLGSQNGGHHGRRLRKLLKPNGRRAHIAATPEDHVRLERSLPALEPDDNFDIYIQGSPEHLEVVREMHSHHEERRALLRSKHTAVYDEFEAVRTDLDILAAELHSLTGNGIALDANFSKFGYDAHIRTREPDSSSDTLSGEGSGYRTPIDWDAEKLKGKALKFWRRPVVRQYFHKGLLWRASEIEEVASFELFIDLLYVGIIAIIGDSAAEEASGLSLLRFAIAFILGWKMWSDLTLVISWFEMDDIFQRICILFVMICLFGFTLNIVEAFESTWIQLIAFYLAQRLFNALYYLWIGYLIPMVRGYMVCQTILIIIPSALWIASIQFQYPSRLALIWPAIVFDLFAPICVIALKRFLEKDHPLWAEKTCRRWFDFFPALNIEHKTERTNAFVTLVFGYSVVALLFQNRAPYGINAFFGKAVLGLIQAFCFNWLYFEIDSWNLHTHAIRRHMVSSLLWTIAHLPFIMGYVIAGASLSRLVLATDCQDARLDALTDKYKSNAEPEIRSALRTFYGAGLGVALLSMSVISLCHVHKEFSGQRLGKKCRLAVRVSIAIILICLSFAERLSSLQLVSTTSGLVVIALVVDVYGSTDVNDSFWQCKRQSKYSADCPFKRQTIVDAVKAGTTIDMAEMRGPLDEKGVFDQL